MQGTKIFRGRCVRKSPISKEEAKRQSFAFLLFRFQQRTLYAGRQCTAGFSFFLQTKVQYFLVPVEIIRLHTRTKECKILCFLRPFPSKTSFGTRGLNYFSIKQTIGWPHHRPTRPTEQAPVQPSRRTLAAPCTHKKSLKAPR